MKKSFLNKYRRNLFLVFDLLRILASFFSKGGAIFSNNHRVFGRVYSDNVIKLKKANENIVIFVCETPGRREWRLASILKGRGYKIFLFYRFGDVYQGDNYLKVIKYDTPFQLIYMMAYLDGQIEKITFHLFSNMGDWTSLLLTVSKGLKRLGNIHVILDYYDLVGGLSKVNSILKAQFFLDRVLQALSIKYCDGLCVRDLQYSYLKRVEPRFNSKRYLKPLVYVPNIIIEKDLIRAGTTKSITKKKGRIDVVQIGWMGMEKLGENDQGCFKVVSALIKGGCHVHIFRYPSMPPFMSKAFRALFADYLKLKKDTNRLHLYDYMPRDDLLNTIKQFDFGLNAENASLFNHPQRSWFNYCGASSRQIDYLLCGLPIICDNRLKFVKHLYARHGAFIPVDWLLNQRNISKSLNDRRALFQKEAIYKKFEAKKYALKLADFYEKV